MQNLYVGITDSSWLNFLKNHKSELGSKINFWTPGNKVFKAIDPGSLFLFKLHAQKSKGEKGKIAGGAYFYKFERMQAAKAWENFKFGNGAASLFEMQSNIRKYRENNNIAEDDDIGCIILENPFFFNEKDYTMPPSDWSPNIVSGKKYDVSSGTGYELYDEVSIILHNKNN